MDDNIHSEKDPHFWYFQIGSDRDIRNGFVAPILIGVSVCVFRRVRLARLTMEESRYVKEKHTISIVW